MEKDEILQCLRGLSNIEGYIIDTKGVPDIIGEHFDFIIEKLHSLLK